MQQLLNITPHLKHVATLPCEMFMSENSLLISEIHLVSADILPDLTHSNLAAVEPDVARIRNSNPETEPAVVRTTRDHRTIRPTTNGQGHSQKFVLGV